MDNFTVGYLVGSLSKASINRKPVNGPDHAARVAAAIAQT
jgi:hypothetical protein